MRQVSTATISSPGYRKRRSRKSCSLTPRLPPSAAASARRHSSWVMKSISAKIVWRPSRKRSCDRKTVKFYINRLYLEIFQRGGGGVLIGEIGRDRIRSGHLAVGLLIIGKADEIEAEPAEPGLRGFDRRFIGDGASLP